MRLEQYVTGSEIWASRSGPGQPEIGKSPHTWFIFVFFYLMEFPVLLQYLSEDVKL